MRKNKSIIALLVSLCICICFFTFSVHADSNSSISIELDKTEAKVGDMIKATIKVTNIENFSGYQVNLRYNPTVLEAYDPSSGNKYEESTNPSGNDILLNQSFSPLPMSDNIPSGGVLNFGRSYLSLADYKNSGKAETTGTLAVINFKVIKDAATELIFEDLGTMPGSVDGTLLFNWEGKQIKSGYDVKMSPKINPNSEAAPMPKYTMKSKGDTSKAQGSNNNSLIIVILVVVILVTISALVLLLRSGKGKDSTDDETHWLDGDDNEESDEDDSNDDQENDNDSKQESEDTKE
jgi:hypothetical protein